MPADSVLLSSIAAAVTAIVAAGTWFLNRRKQKVDESTAAASLVWEVAKATQAEAKGARADASAAREAAQAAEATAHRLQAKVEELQSTLRAREAESRAWRTWCSQDPPCLVRGADF